MAFEVEPLEADPPRAVGPDDNEAVTQAELRQLLKLNRPTFYRWQKAGKFKRLEIHLGGGVRKRYSRKLVNALLAGETVGFKRSA